MKELKKLNKYFINDPYFSSPVKQKIKELIGPKIISTIKRAITGSDSYYTKQIDETKIIFIHIPKAAGTSIAKEIYGSRQGHHIYKSYQEIDPKKFKEYFKFSFVRNPTARVYSAYNYLMQSPHQEDREFFKKELSKYKNFDDFVDSWLSPYNIECWKHFYPQHKFIFNENRELMVDFVGRVEDINSDIQRLNTASGLDLKETHENKTEKKENPISKSSMKKIAEVYKLDFELLGY